MVPRKNLYPAFIIVIIISFLCFLGWSAIRAADSGPEVTDADYYSKGLRYTSTILEKKAASTLGWSISTKLEGRTLSFLLSDKDGKPVGDAKGTISFYLPATSERAQFPLLEAGSGDYQLNLAESMKGEMSARIEFESEGARLNRQLLLNL